ncbi:hypothetical protein [Aeromonas sp. s1(2024)]|uniref:hypothetical protein n=1 Tax=Aeromonas sp. s1(2024) TaxID=3138495 RepID=UPI0034A4F178
MSQVESKPLQKLRNRIEQEKQNLQILDVALLGAHKISAKESGSLAKVLGYDESKYDQLHIPANQSPRLLAQAKNANYKAAIINLYSLWTDYMRGILALLYETNPHQIAQKSPGEIKYSEIISLGDYESIKMKICDNVFRALENERSTSKLLDKIIRHTNISIKNDIKTNALAYLEMRHLFIHNSGRVDAKFKKNYGSAIDCTIDWKLPTRFFIVENAFNAVILLCQEVDKSLLSGNYIKSRAG